MSPAPTGPTIGLEQAAEEAASVGRASTPQIHAMAGVLARAFFDDPVFTWVLRGDGKRMRILERGFELLLRRVWMDSEQTYTTANVTGVAVWEPPGHWRHPLGEQLGLAPAMLAVFGRHLPRVLKALAVLESGHPEEPEHPAHYYLAFIGVDPPWQGRGLGGATLGPVL